MRTETLPMATPTQNQPAPGSPAPIQGQPVPASPPQDRPPAAAPSNILDKEIANEPPPLDQKQLQDAGHMNQAEAADLGKILVPPFDLMADTEGYGYPKGSRVYKLDMQQVLYLAIMNARFYQFNVEQVYLQAIPVTLQRFIFGPQFYAGLSPLTGVLDRWVLAELGRRLSVNPWACRLRPTRLLTPRGSRPLVKYRH